MKRLLKEILQQLAATGSSGFEGLIQRLLGRLTGYQFYLAQSGTQAGRDTSSDRIEATVLAVECKRYGDDTELKLSELLGKMVQATQTIPQLDVWALVASRDVPDQVYSELQHLAVRLHVDLQVISAGDGFPSSLEVLCAHSPDVVLSYLKSSGIQGTRAVEKELERIAADPQFSTRRDRIKASFTAGAGFDATRSRLREWLIARFSSAAESRGALGQAIDVDAQRQVGRLVPRPGSMGRFDEWLASWPITRSGLVVLGEEGDGKTWAVASWLSRRLYADGGFPPVIWLPSQEVNTQEFEVLIEDALTKRLGTAPRGWIDRLKRWSEISDRTKPSLILVLDGLNERHVAGWWRPLIESLGSSPWRNGIAPVATARSGFWPPVARLPHVRWTSWTVPPFDDDELNVALQQAGIKRHDLPDEVLKLVRKPRYFDLAVRHRTAMVDSGDVTVARLIYEDWRDRNARRAGLPGESDFQTLIMDLAARHRRGLENLAKRDLLDAIQVFHEREALLGELETGGILVPDGRDWRVEPSRLAMGLGLILAEELRDPISQRTPAELLASFLEPQPDMDLKAAVLESAALHALETDGFPTDLRAFLLGAWLTHRNAPKPTEHAVAAYFPLDPQAYLLAAETIWSDSTNDGWAELLLKAAYSRWSGIGSFRSDFRRSFEKWLGFVHIDGSPAGISAEDRASRRSELASILGRELAPGPFEYAGTNLTAVEDDGLLRLGRLALAIISEGDRRSYARALIAAHVADALMQYPDKLEISRWIIQTSADDLWPVMEPEIERLVRVGSRTTQKAAYRLLTSIGTRPALEIRAALPDDLFPKHGWIREHEKDPCSSGFAWRREHCEQCAGRDDLPPHFLAKQLAKCVRDPTFIIPAKTSERLATLLAEVQPNQIWSGPFTTVHEIRFDEAEPVVSSSDPAAFAEAIGAIARDVSNRVGLRLRQLAFQLLKYRPVLGTAELAAIRSKWDTLRKQPSPEDRENERAEWALFELGIRDLPGEQQLEGLLDRHASLLLLTRFTSHFKPVPWSVVREHLGRATESSDICKILFFASAHPEALDSAAGDDLTKYFGSADRLVRLLALELTYRGNFAKAAQELVKGSWNFNGVDDDIAHEDHWGSLILAKWGLELSYDELRARIDPSVLGRAIVARGSKPDEIQRYANDVDEVWSRAGSQDTPVDDAASIELRARSIPRNDDFERAGVLHSAFSRTLTFRSRNASWGGPPSSAPIADILQSPTDEDFERLHVTLRETLTRQRQARNSWFAQRFSLAGLAEVVDARPDLIDRWLGRADSDNVGIARRIWFARSFYEALCEVLLSKQPALGAEIYRLLQEHGGAVRFVEHGTDIPLLDYGLFQAVDCAEVRALWDGRLNDARADRDLLVVALLAQARTGRAWLAQRLTSDLASATPFVKARAVLMRGFIESPSAPEDVTASPTDAIEWQREQQNRAIKFWKQDQWAQEWFRRFLLADSDAKSIAAFRLFLTCVDSRFTRWRDAIMTGAREDRRSFVETEDDEIERWIQKNEADLKKTFLGMGVVDRQVWPWL